MITNEATSSARRAAAVLAIVLSVVAPPTRAAEPTGSRASTAPAATAVDLAAGNAAIADPASVPARAAGLTADDEAFLDDLQRRGVRFFVDEADPETGLMPDRARADGGPSNGVSSIASVGFGLTALCIAAERGWLPRQEAYDRSLRVLKFLRDRGPQSHGHFYHFLDMRTGRRVWDCEVSNIDTALLMAGVLTARQYFPDTELARVANELYERVDWPWLTASDGTLCMGWKPESGFLEARWDTFSEGLMIYLLAIGSKTHPLPPEAWRAWRRQPVVTYAGLTFMQCPPLFTHQYPHAWFDLRSRRDDFADYFRNGQLATLAQRQWCADDLSKRFPTYGPDVWGITASDGPRNYQAWGGPPAQGDIDGSVVPCAAGGSLAFQPRLCVDALKAMRQRYGEKAYRKYGFVDAFNPTTGWYNPDVLGIDVGATVLMAENCRTGFVWRTFMSAPEARAALKAAGFRPVGPAGNDLPATTSLFPAPAATGASDDTRRR